MREHIAPWVRARGGLLRVLGTDWRGAVICNEAHSLSREAQDALKDLLEQCASSVRFIFTTNWLDNLDGAIRSRCEVIEMQAPPFEERVRFLGSVLAEEGIEADPLAVTDCAFAYEDMRELLRGPTRGLHVRGLSVARCSCQLARARLCRDGGFGRNTVTWRSSKGTASAGRPQRLVRSITSPGEARPLASCGSRHARVPCGTASPAGLLDIPPNLQAQW